MPAEVMSTGAMLAENGNEPSAQRIDSRLVQWLAVQMVQDARARLVEGGAGADATIELASVFVNLTVTVRGKHDRHGIDEGWVIQSVCAQETTEDDEAVSEQVLDGSVPSGPGGRWLLVGGPGSGKSTATTMIAQLLRRSWIEQQQGDLPESLRTKVEPIGRNLDALAVRLEVKPRRGVLPLRVNLPSLAQWMVPRNTDDPSAVLWRYLATRMVEDTATQGLTSVVTEEEVETMIGAAGHVLWIFDGLDEVPRAAGRDKVVAVIRAALCSHEHHAPELVVTTRPQGYEGELEDLATMVLEPMPVEQASDYSERLLCAWLGDNADLAARREEMRRELERPEIQALVQTPLHTTMAALLVAMQGSLPRSRWLLFDHYFTTIFKRELSKPGGHGFRAEDQGNIRELHARVGLVLHVRAQDQAGVRPTLSRRELRDELAAIFREKGHTDEDVTENTERMMRFATERLVLLLHAHSGEYSYGIRSLQEFFAADALLRGERAQVRRRLEAIALDPHWANVLALVASKCALADGGQTRADLLEYTAGLCRALNDGVVGGKAARYCLTGSRLALAMLRETERYGEPWLHNPLWEIALEASASPVQFEVQRRAMQASYEARYHGSTPSIWNDDLELHMRLGLVAAGWDGAGKKARRDAIRSAARDLLTGSEEQKLAGWLLLHGLLLVDDPDAVQLADQHAPVDRDEAHWVLEAVLSSPEIQEIPPWFVRLIQAHTAWFTPAEAPWRALDEEARPEGPPFDAVHLLDALGSRSFKLVMLDGSFEARVVSIDQRTSRWNTFLETLPCDSVEWEVWRKIATFHATPSHAALADVLQVAIDPAALQELLCHRRRLAWPLVACADFAGQPDGLRALAERARKGDLGTVDDWRAAEARWRNSLAVTPEEWQDWLAPGPLPWNPAIVERGVVLVDRLVSVRPTRSAHSEYIGLRDNLFQQIMTSPQHSARAVAMLGALLVDRRSTPRPETIPLRVARSAEDIGPRGSTQFLFWVDRILPDVTGPDSDAWFDLLDERGQHGRNQWSGASAMGPAHWHRCAEIADALVTRLHERPGQWGLASALLVMVRVAPDVDLTMLPPLQIPADAPADVTVAAAFLHLLSRPHDTAEFTSLVRRLFTTAESDQRKLHNLLADILVQRGRDPDLLLAILTTALEEGPPDGSLRDALLGALFARLRRSAQPTFTTPEAWSDHALPGPFLSGQEPERPPPRLVRLIELTNIRLFKETPSVDVPFPEPPVNSGQWIILTGENGIGKTTLLRGLALALASPAVASKLLDERLPMIRNGGEGHVTIELDAGILDAVVRFKERTETVETGPRETDNTRRPWVVGYGVRRGNARGEQDREPEWGPLGELHTLFDRPASLVNAADWLIKLERQVLREERQQTKEAPSSPMGSRAAVWQSVVQALKDLLGVTAVEPEDEHVFVQHPQFGRVRLDALSDGYLTTTGWVIDLVARWIDRQRELDEPVGLDVLRRMTGFVLIDEIDLHLHPVWQMKVIDDVRRLFPRLSFVVTTHNPLTLQGARRGEVYVMRRDGSRIELVQRDIRPGHDVDRVLFEQFGIEHTFDKETRSLLQQHREMLERGARIDDPARLEVEARLAARLGGVGEIVRAERRGGSDPLPGLSPDEQHLLTPFMKKRS